jgi:D-arabinose 1-dehydrogenase-like Zn-dependent alcohol dehydrogenase
MRLACPEDFEEKDGLYWPPYGDYPFFTARAEWIAQRYCGAQVLIAGCGWGYTVLHARALGVDCRGVDASPYALRRARELGLEDVVVYGDITRADRMPELEVDVVLTEDVYPMLTLDEVEQAQEVLHSYGEVAHWVSPILGRVHPAIQCALSPKEWVEFLAPDPVMLVGA